MDAYTAVIGKRDSRTFSDRPVPEDVLHRVLQAGRMAGSAKNLQPCRFVVVREEANKKALAAGGDFAAWIPSAPVNIAVVIPNDGREFDAGRAAQNIMVVAHAEGMASCPVTMHHADVARQALGLPGDHRVSIVVALGYPGAGEGRIRGARLPVEEYVRYERWR